MPYSCFWMRSIGRCSRINSYCWNHLPCGSGLPRKRSADKALNHSNSRSRCRFRSHFQCANGPEDCCQAMRRLVSWHSSQLHSAQQPEPQTCWILSLDICFDPCRMNLKYLNSPFLPLNTSSSYCFSLLLLNYHLPDMGYYCLHLWIFFLDFWIWVAGCAANRSLGHHGIGFPRTRSTGACLYSDHPCSGFLSFYLV